ncbi:fatty-acid amide hydrolase 2-like protein [Dinothrombium tinctorium]|uniref:Fatty-acid amide hydrolase 2-like protein n=1 Tax=Dinothrombium tinctorium TaxID=1965070 RepID=A0A3S3Q7L2_9ACAR|nr:fatty-acid amide hydrolase 2-like protein [Dinothrombium tinctorium]
MFETLLHFFFKLSRALLDCLSIVFGLLNPSKVRRLPPISDSILLRSSVELSRKIKSGELRSEQVVKAYCKRIEQVQPFINAVVDSRFEKALEEAREVDRKIAEILSGKVDEELLLSKPLLGLPFTCKDSIAIKDMNFDAGSLLLKGNKATNNATVINNLCKSGGIPVALTNVPELVLWWDSDNRIYGRGNNPYDLSRITGGSSGGEAALIAACGSLVGVGSDIGGSIRLPSMCCGVFGHRTTPGVIPIEGMYPPPCDGWLPYLSFGPLCRYAVDIIPMLKAMAGPEVERLNLDKKVDLSKLKIYYMLNDGGNPLNSPVSEEIQLSMKQAVKYFENKYKVEIIKLDLKEMRDAFLFWIYAMKSGDYYTLSSELNLRKNEINPLLELIKSIFNLSRFTRPLLLLACLEKFSPSPDSKFAKSLMRKLDNLKLKLLKILGSDGVFFYPTLPIPAVKHKTTIFSGLNCGYTMIFNVLSFPATHCPMGLGKENVPIGFQVASSPFNDRLTIAVACELERAFGGWVSPSF